MPLHKGHEALVEFALQHCEKVILCVCWRKDEPIDPDMRFWWVVDHYKNDERIFVASVDNEEYGLPSTPIPTPKTSKIWADYLKDRFSDFDCIISSEEYGHFMAASAGVEHILFDLDRTQVPISATMIRENPEKYADYISDEAKNYFKSLTVEVNES